MLEEIFLQVFRLGVVYRSALTLAMPFRRFEALPHTTTDPRKRCRSCGCVTWYQSRFWAGFTLHHSSSWRGGIIAAILEFGSSPLLRRKVVSELIKLEDFDRVLGFPHQRSSSPVGKRWLYRFVVGWRDGGLVVIFAIQLALHHFLRIGGFEMVLRWRCFHCGKVTAHWWCVLCVLCFVGTLMAYAMCVEGCW